MPTVPSCVFLRLLFFRKESLGLPLLAVTSGFHLGSKEASCFRKSVESWRLAENNIRGWWRQCARYQWLNAARRSRSSSAALHNVDCLSADMLTVKWCLVVIVETDWVAEVKLGSLRQKHSHYTQMWIPLCCCRSPVGTNLLLFVSLSVSYLPTGETQVPFQL